MDRVVITTDDLAHVAPASSTGPEPSPASPAIPLWAKLLLVPFVAVLPALAVVAIILRVALRNEAPRVRQHWVSYLCTLLIASGILTSIVVTIAFSMQYRPQVVSSGLADLDERNVFPTLPAAHELTPSEIAETFKPLVVVASPEQRSWIVHRSQPSGILGSGVLLYSGVDGYLFATAKHVVNALTSNVSGRGVMLSTINGGWSRGVVVGTHSAADLALVWIGRVMGSGSFCQPLSIGDIHAGQTVFVIGHPEGLTFALSSGIVARVAKDQVVQITAPVSPGNSGGPVYDQHGSLLGIVSSMLDPRESQNVNFAVRSDLLRDADGWRFTDHGRDYFEKFRSHCITAEAPKALPANTAATGTTNAKH